MHKQLLRSRLPIVIGLIVATGCSTLHTNTTASSAPPLTANGRSIFQTGKDLSGVQIVARKPPLFGVAPLVIERTARESCVCPAMPSAPICATRLL